MMPVFRGSRFQGECEQCGRRFDPVSGGVCAECGRILCADDLHGGWLRRVRALVGLRLVCVECSAGRTPARPWSVEGGAGDGRTATR